MTTRETHYELGVKVEMSFSLPTNLVETLLKGTDWEGVGDLDEVPDTDIAPVVEYLEGRIREELPHLFEYLDWDPYVEVVL